MLLKIIYRPTCRVLAVVVLVFRGDRGKDAELLGHENAVLRRNASRACPQPGDRVRFAALARVLPRRRWTDVLPVTPATLLACTASLLAASTTRANGASPAGRRQGAILQPPKPEIRPSPEVLQRAADRDADREAAD